MAGIAVAAFLAFAPFGPCEAKVRSTGGFLQLMGLGTVAYQLSGRRALFGLPPLLDVPAILMLDFAHALHQLFLRLIVRRPPPQAVKLDGISAG